MKNIVALGALQGATGLLAPETYVTAMRQVLHAKALGALNEEAFARGVAAALEAGSSSAFGWWI